MGGNIDTFPLDLLVTIFEYLPYFESPTPTHSDEFLESNTILASKQEFSSYKHKLTLRLVCKQFNLAISHRRLNYSVNLSWNIGAFKCLKRLSQVSFVTNSIQCLFLDYCENIPSSTLSLVFSHFTVLQTLSLKWVPTLTDKVLSYLADNQSLASHLLFLNICGCEELTDQGIAHLICCHNLLSLKLSFCKNITDHGLSQLFSNNIKFQSLNLGFCDKITDQSLLFLSQTCHDSLVSLNLTHCSHISNEGMYYVFLCKNLQKLFVEGCPHIDFTNLCSLDDIKKLTHSFTMTTLDCPSAKLVNNASLRLICSIFTNLSVLNVSNLAELSDEGVRHIINLKHIISLDLSHCQKLTDKGLMPVFSQCIHLQILNLEGLNQMTDQSLERIAKHLLQLKNLNLKECMRVSADGLMYFSNSMVKLSALNLGGCRLSDATFLTLMVTGGNLDLKRLDISHCEPGESILLLLNSPSASRSLSYLSLEKCNIALFEEFMELLGASCPNLISLNLDFITGSVNDKSLENLAKADLALESLNLNGGVFSNHGLRSLILKKKIATTLQFLELGHCRYIDSMIFYTLSHCENLQSLYLTGCFQFLSSSNYLQSLKESCPYLNIYN